MARRRVTGSLWSEQKVDWQVEHIVTSNLKDSIHSSYYPLRCWSISFHLLKTHTSILPLNSLLVFTILYLLILLSNIHDHTVNCYHPPYLYGICILLFEESYFVLTGFVDDLLLTCCQDNTQNKSLLKFLFYDLKFLLILVLSLANLHSYKELTYLFIMIFFLSFFIIINIFVYIKLSYLYPAKLWILS